MSPVVPAAGGDQAKGLAAAIAVVSCEGGASAEAFAKALSQSIETDKNGCKVLVTASSYAIAKCGPNGAFAQSGSSVSRVSTSCEGRTTWRLRVVGEHLSLPAPCSS